MERCSCWSNSTTLGSTTAALAVNPGGTLDLNGTNQTVGALNGVNGTGIYPKQP